MRYLVFLGLIVLFVVYLANNGYYSGIEDYLKNFSQNICNEFMEQYRLTLLRLLLNSYSA